MPWNNEEVRLGIIEEGMTALRRDVAEIKTAVLGDLHGFVGVRQKADEAYETMLVMREEQKDLKRDVAEIKQANHRRNGMLVGFGVVAGSFLGEYGKKLMGWFSSK